MIVANLENNREFVLKKPSTIIPRAVSLHNNSGNDIEAWFLVLCRKHIHCVKLQVMIVCQVQIGKKKKSQNFCIIEGILDTNLCLMHSSIGVQEKSKSV